LEQLNSFRLVRVAARINRSCSLLKLTDLQKQENLKNIEQIILSRRSDLKLMNPDLLYSIVLAFTNAKM
jgi:hypothetical protein